MLFCLYSQCLIGIGLHFVQRLAVFMGLRQDNTQGMNLVLWTQEESHSIV